MSAGPITALYYSDTRTTCKQIVGALDNHGQKSVASGTIDLSSLLPRTARPFEPGGDKLVWFYSEAPLQSVQRIRLCIVEDSCIGIRLQYKEFDITLGQYRVDKKSEKCFDDPQWVKYTTECDNQSGTTRTELAFSRSKPSLDGWFRMAGVMTWWFRPGRSEINIVY